jgi:hypothetical protein
VAGCHNSAGYVLQDDAVCVACSVVCSGWGTGCCGFAAMECMCHGWDGCVGHFGPPGSAIRQPALVIQAAILKLTVLRCCLHRCNGVCHQETRTFDTSRQYPLTGPGKLARPMHASDQCDCIDRRPSCCGIFSPLTLHSTHSHTTIYSYTQLCAHTYSSAQHPAAIPLPQLSAVAKHKLSPQVPSCHLHPTHTHSCAFVTQPRHTPRQPAQLST